MDYDLTRLSERDFEHLSQALMFAQFGAGVTAFGDGPDGGREASFEGVVQIPAHAGGGVWAGYGIMQAKLRRRPQRDGRDGSWLAQRITAELEEWSDPRSRRVTLGRVPEFLLITTNVVLTPTPGTGGIDVLDRIISQYASTLGLKAWWVWHFDTLCRLLDVHQGVRRSYASLITASDVLAQMQEILLDLSAGRQKNALTPAGYADIHTGDEARLPPRLPAPPSAIVGLPRDTSSFVNREGAIERICAEDPGPAPVYAIDGMPGVGKTSFAVHVAHRIAARYEGGIYFLGLHSRDRLRTPVTPELALAALLQMAGVIPARIPDGLDARTRLWRSIMATRQVLCVFDDAESVGQLEPLIPPGRMSLTIVTSRRRLSLLDGAVPVSLSPLEVEPAAELFSRIVGDRPSVDELEPLGHIIRWCGGLPLAVKIVASRLRNRPVWSVADMVTLLAETEHPVDEMIAGGDGVARAFESAYRDLDPELQESFRLLGLHPGPEFDVHVAAALFGSDLRTARRTLESLYDYSLVDQPGFGRYLFHDLIFDYAKTLVGAEEASAVEAATARLLSYYVVAADAADGAINLLGARSAPPDLWPALLPALTAHKQAMDWFEAERTNLYGAIRLADDVGDPAKGGRIARALIYFLRLRGHWEETLELCQAATDLFARIADREGIADVAFYRADIYRLTGDRASARSWYRDVLALYRELGDRIREARALHSLGDIDRAERRYDAAVGSYRSALTIYRENGTSLAAARAMHSIGDALRLSGQDGSLTAANYWEALAIYRQENDKVGEVRVLHSLADIETGTHPEEWSLDYYLEILGRYRTLGDRLGEADATASIGDAHIRRREFELASRRLNEALAIYRDLGDRPSQARTLHLIGSAHEQAEAYGDAERLYGEAADIWRETGDLELALQEWIAASRVIREGSGLLAAIEYLQRVADLHLGEADDLALVVRNRIASYRQRVQFR